MNIIGKLKEQITAYIDVYIRLFKLNLIGHISKLMSYMMFALICFFIFFCIILYMGFGLTEVFIEAGLSKMASFFIITGIYVAFLALIMAFRKNITRFFAGGIIDVMTEGDEEDKELKG
jgi:hypothetical protein